MFDEFNEINLQERDNADLIPNNEIVFNKSRKFRKFN